MLGDMIEMNFCVSFDKDREHIFIDDGKVQHWVGASGGALIIFPTSAHGSSELAFGKIRASSQLNFPLFTDLNT